MHPDRIKLAECAIILPGGTPRTNVGEYWGGSIPWLSIKDLECPGRYVYNTEKTITEKGLSNSSTSLLTRDDIIISARGTVGALAMVGRAMAFNQSCFGIRAKPNIIPSFLYYSLKQSVNTLKQNSYGSVFNSFKSKNIAELEIWCPEITIQQSISSILASIDDKIELNKSINDNLGGVLVAS